MATQNISIGVNVSDNGTAKKTVKSFEEIAAAATKAQTAAAGISAPVKSTLAPGGTSGSRKASEPTGSQQMMGGQEYGQARGSAGLTGAGARDFANQAQGLGGLVRLYATLAANIFAASAAYTALSNAMDTTNLVKGLNMLGAVSGQNLGTLSKRLVEVTDGAVSMREAMTAVAQSSSAGMSGKNIERLAQVAKNASLALGVAMPDALNRLSRGIVKLEPELLDELGLFTKIGPATERYALEIGKSATALSDFERRQAFANAVLEEGEKKFGALSQAASNPYDKLLATLKNVLQSGGELINKVLAPIVGLLAESPSALAAVIAGLGVVLLKQALPAVGQLRAGLRNTAEDALATAEAFKESFGDEFQTRLEQRFKIPDLQAGLKKAEADLAKLKVPTNIAGSVTKLAAGDIASLKNVEEALKKKTLTAEKGMRGSKQASEAQIEQARQEVTYIKAVIAVLEQKQALERADIGAQGVADVVPGRFDPETIALQKYDTLRRKVDKANIISNAAQNAQIMGIRGAFAQLNNEIAEKNIKGFEKLSTQAQGGLAAIGTRAMGIIGSLGRVGEVAALAVAGFMLLDSWFSKNSKQVEKFNTALTTSQEAMANVSRTISAASDINGFGTATINNTVAFSNALNELSGSLSEVIKLSREADKAAGTWDNFWDGVFSFVGKDRASKLAKTVAGQIQSSLDLLKREGLAETYKTEVQKILQVDDLENIDKVSEAFKNLSKEQQNALTAIQNNANRLLGNAGSALQSFKDKTDEALKAQKTLSNSFLDTSPSFKYGESLVAVSSSLNALIAQGPKRVAQALEELSTNMEKAAMFGPEFVSEFGKISAEFGKQKAVIDGLNNALVTYQKQLSVANTAAGTRGATFTETEGAPSAMRGTSTEDLARGQGPRQQAYIANSDVREIQRALNNAPRDAVDKSLKLVEAAAKSLFDRGMAFIGKAVRDAQNTASITIGKALTANLTGPQKLQADAAFAQQELKVRLADISISEQMMDTQTQLVNEMKLANALQTEANILQRNAGKTDLDSLAQNKEATRQVQLAGLSAKGIGAAEMLGSDLLTDKDKENIKRDQARQKSVQQAALKPAKVLAESQLDASQIGLRSELPISQAQQEEELKKITDRTTASLAARQDVMSGIASVTSAEIIKSKQNAELAEKALQQNRELGVINDKIAQAEMLYAEALARKDEGAKTAQEGQLKQLNFLKRQKLLTEEAQTADTSLTVAKNKQPLLAQELVDLDKRYELLRSTSDLENQTATTRLDTQSQLLSLQGSANEYSQEYMITSQSALDREKLLLDTNIAMQQAQDALTQKREAAELRVATLRKDGAEKNKALIDAETTELSRQETLTNNVITGLSNQFNSKSAILDKTKQINLEQDRYNQLLEISGNLANAFVGAFKNLGQELANLTTSIASFAVSSEKGAKALDDLEFDRDAENDPKKRLALEDEIIKQRTKNTRTELAGNAKIAEAAKSLFKEKTVAYKAFAAVEKGLQLASLALEIKTTLTKMGLWAAEVPAKAASEAGVTAAGAAGAAARAPLTFGEIVGNYLAKIPPPFGMIAGVAAGAYFLSLLGKSKSGNSMPAGFTGEQQQAVQGTGQAYNAQGQIVTRAGGALGDSKALAKSVETSIETLGKNFFGIFDTDNSKLINTLKSIQANTKETAIALLQGASGLFGGRNPFGFEEGSSKGALGFSKSSSTILDEGVKVTGTLGNLAKGIGEFDQYINTRVKKSSWWGLSSSTSFNSQLMALEETSPRAVQAIVKTFADVREALLESADFFYGDNNFAEDIINNASIELRASAKDLSASEFADLLMAEISVQLNAAAELAFPKLTGFQELGEEMYQTLARLQKDSQTVSDGFAMIGMGSKELTGTMEENTRSFFELVNRSRTLAISSSTGTLADKTQLEQDLIAAAGGAESFAEGIGNVFNDFFDDSKRFEQTFGRLNQVFRNAGIQLPKTKAEYLSLIETTTDVEQLGVLIKYTGEYTNLVELQNSALSDTISNLESSIDGFKNFSKDLRSFRDNLVLGSFSILSPLEKFKEAEMQYETILASALAGDEKAQGQYQSAAQAFLTASKDYFASSGQNTENVNRVLNDIALGIGESENQITLAKQQLSTLESIDANIATIAGVPQAAKGGRVSGLTLVGEMGPELVDFSYPAQVYPADQTRGMFAPQPSVSNNMSQVVQELRQVKQELAQLRKEQQQQTGDLIISNYDANNRAAEAVTTEVANAATLKEWQQRNKVAVV